MCRLDSGRISNVLMALWLDFQCADRVLDWIFRGFSLDFQWADFAWICTGKTWDLLICLLDFPWKNMGFCIGRLDFRGIFYRSLRLQNMPLGFAGEKHGIFNRSRRLQNKPLGFSREKHGILNRSFGFSWGFCIGHRNKH